MLVYQRVTSCDFPSQPSFSAQEVKPSSCSLTAGAFASWSDGKSAGKLLFMRQKTCQIMWAKQSSPCQKWYKPSPVMGGLCLFIPTWYRFLHFLKNSKESLDDSLFFSWGPYSSTSWEDRLSEKCDIQDNWRACSQLNMHPYSYIYIYYIIYIYTWWYTHKCAYK